MQVLQCAHISSFKDRISLRFPLSPHLNVIAKRGNCPCAHILFLISLKMIAKKSVTGQSATTFLPQLNRQQSTLRGQYTPAPGYKNQPHNTNRPNPPTRLPPTCPPASSSPS